MSDFLADRRNALESRFFAAKNAELLEKLREEDHREGQKAALADVTGLSDDGLLNQLVELGIQVETVAAMSIVPLLEVAWADRRIEQKEREAVLAAAAENGIAAGSTAHDLLQAWLEEPIPLDVFQAWYDYMSGLCPTLNDEQRGKLMLEIVGRAESVAAAAGGILGIGGVSSAERGIIDKLKAAFGG